MSRHSRLPPNSGSWEGQPLTELQEEATERAVHRWREGTGQDTGPWGLRGQRRVGETGSVMGFCMVSQGQSLSADHICLLQALWLQAAKDRVPGSRAARRPPPRSWEGMTGGPVGVERWGDGAVDRLWEQKQHCLDRVTYWVWEVGKRDGSRSFTGTAKLTTMLRVLWSQDSRGRAQFRETMVSWRW